MSDKGILWAEQIEERAGHAAKSILDTLEGKMKTQLKGFDRRDLHAAIAEQVTQAMFKLGTFVCAGASESIGVHIEKFTCSGQEPGDVTITLKPLPGVNFLQLLAANVKKSAVLAFVNQEAYGQARAELVREIHREQTDWVQQSEKQAAPEKSGDEQLGDDKQAMKREPPEEGSTAQSEDPLALALAHLRVYVDSPTVAGWSERERYVAWEWAVAFKEQGEACTKARPHWLPIPEPKPAEPAVQQAPTETEPAVSA